MACSTKDLAVSVRSSLPGFDSKPDGQQQGNRQDMIITAIKATDLVVGLNRIPAGFYVGVCHSDLEWKTPNKFVSVNNEAIEWRALIPVPFDLSATIRIGIYAPFEFQPTLGRGEVLRELTITVQELLDRNEKDPARPFNFSSLDGDVRLPCSSLMVNARRRRHKSGESLLAPGMHGLYCSTAQPLDQVENETDQGHNALLHYRRHKDIRDLECSIRLFQGALDKCPCDHPCRAAAQSNLATAKFAHCQADNTDPSFGVPVTLYCDALAARPTDHPDRPSTLVQLASVHLARFQRQNDPVDVAQAVNFLREAIDLTSIDSHETSAAISTIRQHANYVLGQIGGAHPDFALDVADENAWILSLGGLLLHHFERSGCVADLQQTISLMEGYVSLLDHPTPAWQGDLGLALWHRFCCLGAPDDLLNAIQKQTDAVTSTLGDHPSRPRFLTHLGNSLLSRFECLGGISNLTQAILRHREAADLTPEGHPNKSCYVGNLGTAVMTRFVHLNELADIEEAISLYREAVRLVPDQSCNKPAYLNHLATSFRARFKSLNKLHDIEEAISRHQKAIEVTPKGNCNKHVYLNNLAISFHTRFLHLGELSNLDRAISLHVEALALVPDSHLIKPKYLNDLANCLRMRFECLEAPTDLEEAILRHQQAMELAGPKRNSHVYFNSKANSYLIRFKYFGDSEDLVRAISGYQAAMSRIPTHSRYKPAYLNDLSTALLVRFEWLGEPSDLESATSLVRKALALAPDGHPDKPDYLTCLAICLRTRFTRYDRPRDLEEAITVHKQAVRLAAYRSTRASIRQKDPVRFGDQGESDVERAIALHREVVRLTPDGHSEKRRRLQSLAHSLLVRFEHFGALGDLEEAASCLLFE